MRALCSAVSEILRFGVVVATELPRDRSTILVRLMAGGPLLAHATEDLRALPEDAHEWVVASPVLLSLHRALGEKPTRTPEEQEFVMTIGQNIAEKLRDEGRREGQVEGRREGQVEGRLEQARAMLRWLLSRRSLVPGVREEARIDGCTDLATLERWAGQALEAESVAEALREEGASARRRAPARRRRSPRAG